MSSILLKKIISNIIKENLENTKKKLHVFDFDMTLYNTDNKTWNEEVLNNLYNSIEDENTRVILCTARLLDDETIDITEELLNTKEISLFSNSQYQYIFNDYYFKPKSKNDNAPKYKAFVISDEVSMFNIDEVKFWDDREDTLKQVEKELKDLEVNYQGIKPKVF